jgi:hypothetical protein
MIGLAVGTRIWIVAGVTDMRRGFTGLSGMVQTALKESPFSGQVYIFRLAATGAQLCSPDGSVKRTGFIFCFLLLFLLLFLFFSFFNFFLCFVHFSLAYENFSGILRAG